MGKGTLAIYELADGTKIQEKSSTFQLDGTIAEIEIPIEIRYGGMPARLVEISHKTWKFS